MRPKASKGTYPRATRRVGLFLGEEQLFQDPGGIFGGGDGVSDGSVVREDLIVVPTLVGLSPTRGIGGKLASLETT